MIFLIIGIKCYSQKVDVFDENHKRIFQNVELKEVGELMKNVEGSKIFIQYWNGTIVKECEFKRINQIILL